MRKQMVLGKKLSNYLFLLTKKGWSLLQLFKNPSWGGGQSGLRRPSVTQSIHFPLELLIGMTLT